MFAEYLLKGEYPMPKFTWNINPATGGISAILDRNGVVASADLWVQHHFLIVIFNLSRVLNVDSFCFPFFVSFFLQYAQSCGVNVADGKNRCMRVRLPTVV